MIASLRLILLVAGLILLVLGAFKVESARFNPTAAGLACWLAATALVSS